MELDESDLWQYDCARKEQACKHDRRERDIANAIAIMNLHSMVYFTIAIDRFGLMVLTPCC